MLSVAAARAIALSLPQAEEREHHGVPDFRVKNKIFATLSAKSGRAAVKLSLADQSALLQSFPESFATNGWSHHGWTDVHLKHVTAARFRDVVTASWRLVAPRSLVAEHAEAKSPKR